MQKLQEKLKELLLLSDSDAALLLRGDFKTLLAHNKEAAVRTAVCYGFVFACFLLYMAMFSVFGVLIKMLLILVLFGTFAGIGCAMGLKKVLSVTRYPAILYFLLFLFGILALSMFSDITSEGSFISELFSLMVLGGLGYGTWALRDKAAAFGCSIHQSALAAVMAASMIMSFQSAFIRFGIEQEISYAKQREEARRIREAEKMRMSLASSKPCTSDEECKKMNTKKNTYYAENEETAQTICEQTVSREIPDRFEWTVGAKEYKFTSYQVDVLNDLITLMGDRAQLIDRNGIRTKLSYTCKFNVKSKTATATVVK